MRFSNLDVGIALAAWVTWVSASPAPVPEPIPVSPSELKTFRRALPDSPTGGYAPARVDCPDDIDNFLRTPFDMNPDEKAFVEKRHVKARKAIIDYLKRVEMENFDVDEFFSAENYTPNYGLAFSGGGYRAMLHGGGVIKAFDSRTDGSTADKNQVGGVLQGATYIAGLSGGSWAIGSVIINNFTTIQAVQDDPLIWDLERSFLAPDGVLAVRDTLDYFRNVRREVESKDDAGFYVTLTDYWGRAISRQIIMDPEDDGGEETTFSSIARTKEFEDAEMPFPIVVALARNPGEVAIYWNSTVFEINPLEFGSHDPQLFSFTKTRWVGTNLTDGRPQEDKCVRGLDNAGFVLGTSSSLFNYPLIQIGDTDVTGFLKNIAVDLLGDLYLANLDIASWSPNPFYKSNPLKGQPITASRNLSLVDGGLDLQNIPLNPLIQPTRNLDLIIAVDSSADTNNWPNGTAMMATFERSLLPIQNHTSFPVVPGVNTFVNKGLNDRPTFFGCAWNETLEKQPPLIIYLPNGPYSFYSNVSTFQMTYETEEIEGLITNGYNVASQGNGTIDNEWGACLGCAMIAREVQSRGVPQTEQCKRCFERYCWDGEYDESTPSASYEPEMKLQKTKESSAGKIIANSFPIVIAGFVMAAVGF